ncbi:unnamed protein product [Rhodiola kirilowii]
MLQLVILILHILAFANDVSSFDRLSYGGEYDGAATYNVLDFGAKGDGVTEDTKALTAAWTTACGNKGGNPTILLPGGKTFLVKVINFDGTNCTFSSVHFQLEGNIAAPATTDWTSCSDNWIGFVNITGLTLDGNGIIDGHGQAFWASRNQTLHKNQNDELYYQELDDCDSVPSALFFVYCTNLQINNVNTINTPGVHFSIKFSSQVGISNVNITAPEDSPNTDGINIFGSVNVTINHTNIATGDDCIAVNSGSQFFNISNVACGPGHGISVGSLGKNGGHATVSDIHVMDSSFTNTQNGARIKTYVGGSGYAKRITFEGITLSNAGNPILIDQHYCAHNTCPDEGTSAVHISDISFINFRGTSADEAAIKLLCDKVQDCSDIFLNDVDITSTNPKTPAQANCTFVTGTQTKTSPPVSCLKG